MQSLSISSLGITTRSKG